MATNQDKIEVNLRRKVRQVQRAAGPEHDTHPSECAGTSRQQEPANIEDDESSDKEVEGSPDEEQPAGEVDEARPSRNKRPQMPSGLGVTKPKTKPRFACRCSSTACSRKNCGCVKRGLKCFFKCSCYIARLHCQNPLNKKPN